MMRKLSFLIVTSTIVAKIAAESPPGLGRHYGHDVVGHEEEKLIATHDLSEYNNDEEYYESYDDYEEGDNGDYYEDYEDEGGEKGDGAEENSYYDYDYLEEKGGNKSEEEYEYYREESEGVLKLNEETEDDYYEDYYEEDEEPIEANLEDYYEDDYYKDDTDNTKDQVAPEHKVQSTTEKMNETDRTPSPQVSDDEDLTEGSGFEDDEDYHSISKMSTTRKSSSVPTITTTDSTTTASTTTTTTSTTTTTTTTTTTITTTTTKVSEEYYFEEDEEDSYQETLYENNEETLYKTGDDYEDYDSHIKSTSTVESNPGPGTITEDIFIDYIEGSGSSKVFNAPNLSFDISDDEDLVEGSGEDAEVDAVIPDEKNSVVDVEEESPRKELSEAETQKRSEFFELHGLDLLSLDMSCMQNFVSGPDIAYGSLAQYQYNGTGTEAGQFAEAVYECDEGHSLADPRISSLFCQNGTWRGEMPRCEASPGSESGSRGRVWCDEEESGECEQLCYIQGGRKQCECHPGYSLAADGHKCEDIDECQDTNGGCDQVCRNRPGTFMCECAPGYSGSITCLDINECLLNNGHGPCQDTCSNTHGGYECSCENLPGTSLGSDNHTCHSGGGCLSDNGGCSHECIDSYNQVFCMCPDGFLLGSDWKTCEDVNECEADDTACDQLCVNTPGSYHCGCEAGYRSSEATGGCEDINECEEDNGKCSHGCVNTEGGVECTCPLGKKLGGDNMTCLDVDECAVDNGLCQQICINQVGVTCVGVGSHVTCPQAGHAECGCEPGYRLASDGRSCADIDECEVPDICGAGAGDCLNTGGSYTCHCHPGYEDSGQTCVDTDECRDNPCGHGECLNSPGGYECFCQPGYSFDGAECFDLDECFIGNPCINGVCTNIDGGYSCDCDKGYYESEGVCLDVNECNSFTHNPCGAGACVNTDGGFSCQCPQGYQAANNTCRDIDECETDACGEHGDCLNLPGSHQCQCHPGFVLRGAVCVDIDECRDNPCLGGQCINRPGHFECRCDRGFLLDSVTNTCLDQDECEVDNGGCAQVCANTEGARLCSCRPGYRCVDPECLVCQDIDECDQGGECGQLCVNTPGGHHCACHPGHQLAPDNSTCGDINECTMGKNGGCSHQCSNTAGSFKCECPDGWQLGADEKTCKRKQKQFCKPLKRPKFGFFRCTTKATRSGYSLGSRCRLRCRKGYSPEVGGGAVRKLCLSDATWTGGLGTCVPAPVTCPALRVPENGHVSPDSCASPGSEVHSRCRISCREGFTLEGSEAAVCERSRQWRYETSAPPSCQAIRYPPPFIICPPDTVKPLPPDSSSVYVMFPQPKTNVDWLRYVSAEPKWAKQLEGEVKLGKHEVTFTASSQGGSESANCTMNIHVKDEEPPRVISCPQSFEDTLSRGQMLKKVSWSEPVFRDNVGIHQMTASYLPGHYFPEGKHHILYQASDADGNRARCGLTLTIKRERLPPVRTETQHPLSVLQVPPPNLGPPQQPGQPKSPWPQCQQVPDVPNGRMVCLSQQDRLKCTPVCDQQHVFYQKFSSRPPTYICSEHRVDWKITKFIPDCSPVEKSRAGTCPAGWESRDSACVACPPGMFRDKSPMCRLCGKGTFADQFGSSACSPCPEDHFTISLGSRSSRACRNSVRGNRINSLFKKYQHSSINRGWQPPSMTSVVQKYRPQQLTTTATTAAPSTTTARSKSSSHSRAHYKGGLTHYNSWLAEPAHHQRSSLQSSSPSHRRQRQARRYRKHSRRQ